MYPPLLSEAFGLDMGGVAGLTDQQIEHFYFAPARERADRLEREAAGQPARPAAAPAEHPPMTRAEFVASYTAQHGNREHWERCAERLRAEGKLLD